MAVIVVVTTIAGRKNFPGDILTVLLCVEHAPSVLERLRDLPAKQAVDPGVAIRDVNAGDLVVAVVLESRHARERGVDRRESIPSLRENAHRLISRIRVVLADIEQPCRIERVRLGMEPVATIL